MSQEIKVSLGDVTDMEARVYARFLGAEQVILRGKLSGPFCEKGRTLAAEFAFRDLGPQNAGSAEAIVTDPCLWSAEMPQLYRVDVEAVQGEQVVAEYHGTIGLRRLAPRRPVDFAPGTG
jgi:beta-galactosidase/beta-glucuronidase